MGIAQLATQAQVKLSGRSWWEVIYLGGKSVTEWQTTGVMRAMESPIFAPGARSRWEDLDHSKIRTALLWCPDGSVGKVEAARPYSVFQFKVGVAQAGRGHSTQAHVMGAVHGVNGDCVFCEWWSPVFEGRALVSPGRFRSGQGNILALHERYGVGPLSLEAIGELRL